MPIINTNPVTPPTQAQRDAATASALSAQINQSYQQLLKLFTQVKSFVWSNPSQAQAKFVAFGTNATDLVKVSAAFSALVATYTGSAPDILPNGYSLTPNSDGTVTVTFTAPAPTPTPTPTPPVTPAA